MLLTLKQFIQEVGDLPGDGRVLVVCDVDNSLVPEGGRIVPSIQQPMGHAAMIRGVELVLGTGRGVGPEARSYFPPQYVTVGGRQVHPWHLVTMMTSFGHVIKLSPLLSALLPLERRLDVVRWHQNDVLMSPLAAEWREASDAFYSRLVSIVGIPPEFIQTKAIGLAVHLKGMVDNGWFTELGEAHTYAEQIIGPLAASFGFVPYAEHGGLFQEYLVPPAEGTGNPNLYKGTGLETLVELCGDVTALLGIIDSTSSDGPMVEAARRLGILNIWIGVGPQIDEGLINLRVSATTDIPPVLADVAQVLEGRRGLK